MATRAPKEKRRNSEKRKEKSRDAARCRRSKESEIFSDMSQLLPVPNSLSSQLDKASIMRLTIAYLKARALLGSNNDGSGGAWPEEKCLVPNSCWPQALGGILVALSSEGDIIYLTENVTQQLGLPQVDLIGQSVYDYCHPCDHDELRDVLGWRADGDLTRSFFMRLKSTLSVKGRSNNLKAASYKVMNCSGRIVKTAAAAMAMAMGRRSADSIAIEPDFDGFDGNATADDEPEEHAKRGMPSHFLVLIADPIPHPSNIELPLDGYTFLTKHSLDMKYTYVDEKIADFLGYAPSELEGQSAYEYHHVIDNEMILKSYKTMFTKGQMQTQPYRFLARNGGYAWVQTQATLVYGSRDSRPQAIVCVHSCLSGIDEEDEILSANQAHAAGHVTRPLVVAPPVCKAIVPDRVPQKMTAKLFVNKTPEMSEGFLMPPDYISTSGALKEELDDLTHLAPVAGDACIPLEFPPVTFSGEFLDSDELTPELLDCLPLTGFELPLFPAPDDLIDDDPETSPSPTPPTPPSAAVTPAPVKEDPFLFFNNQAAPASSSAASTDSFMNLQKKQVDEDLKSSGPCSTDQVDLKCFSDDDEEMNKRAPYIPMSDDLPLFNTDELFLDFDLDSFPVLPQSKTESIVEASDQSVLVQLLQTTPVKQEKPSPPLLNYQTEVVPPYHGSKRASVGQLDCFLAKRPKTLPLASPHGQPQPARTGNTSSLMELLTEKSHQSASVLQNLLVSGHDSQTGHDLQGRRDSMRSPPRLVSIAHSLKNVAPRTKAQQAVPSSQQHRNESRKALIDEATFSAFGFDVDAPGPGDLGLDASDFFSALNLPVEFSAANLAAE